MMRRSADELVRMAQQGEESAFAELVRRYERTVLAVAYARCGQGDTAADLAQEAFVRAWQGLKHLRQPEGFGPWLIGIARNLAIDWRRRHRTSIEIPQDIAHPDGNPARQALGREMDQHIAAALGSLDEISRCAVTLRYYDGLSSEQIGNLLDLTPAAVDMRLSRARSQLRQLLAPALAGEAPAAQPGGIARCI